MFAAVLVVLGLLICLYKKRKRSRPRIAGSFKGSFLIFHISLPEPESLLLSNSENVDEPGNETSQTSHTYDSIHTYESVRISPTRSPMWSSSSSLVAETSQLCPENTSQLSRRKGHFNNHSPDSPLRKGVKTNPTMYGALERSMPDSEAGYSQVTTEQRRGRVVYTPQTSSDSEAADAGWSSSRPTRVKLPTVTTIHQVMFSKNHYIL